jgi:ribosomal protein L37AE/L43A
MFELGNPVTMYVRCSKCHFAEKHVANSLGPWSCPECGSHTIDLSTGVGVPEWWVGEGKPVKPDIVVTDEDLNGKYLTSEQERVASQKLTECAHCGASARFSTYSGSPVIWCDGCLAMMGGEEYDGTYLQLKTDWNRRPPMVIKDCTFGPAKPPRMRINVERLAVNVVFWLLVVGLVLWAIEPFLRA